MPEQNSNQKARKLGAFGALGALFLWLVGTYLFIAAMGYGFVTEIPMLMPWAKLHQLYYLQRYYSSFDEDRFVLSSTLRAWGSVLSFLNPDSSNSLSSGQLVGVKRLSAAHVEQLLKEPGFRMLNRPPSLSEALKLWGVGGASSSVVCDLYGYPWVPMSSEQLLSSNFPLLKRSAPLSTINSDQKRRSQTTRDAIIHFGTAGEFFSFPLAWRLQKFMEILERKKLGLYIYLVLTLLGVFGSARLMAVPFPESNLPGVLRFAGGLFGIAVLFLGAFRSYASCYQPYRHTDNQVVNEYTMELIRTDCLKYLEDLRFEQKISEEDTKILSDLVRKR